MKRTLLLSSLMMAACAFSAQATVWTVTNSGNTFTPANISIAQGDTVQFNITNVHDAVEVSETTYNANGNTALSGGFSTPFGGGTVLPAALTVGTHWYVCTPHASMGMKGTIVVTPPTAVTNVLAKARFTVSPNPASDFISIQSSESLDNIQYAVVDAWGKQLSTGILSGTQTKIDVRTLAAGLYFVQMGNTNVKRTIKIVKQ